MRDNFEEWQLTIYKEEYKTPNWCKAGIMYQIFPDRFKEILMLISFLLKTKQKELEEKIGSFSLSQIMIQLITQQKIFLWAT